LKPLLNASYKSAVVNVDLKVFAIVSPSIFEELVAARREGKSCVLATIAATRGSVPRQVGSKMIVYPDGTISGTIGGGKFESLLVADCIAALESGKSGLKDYVLREGHPDSFGAICGGELTVLIEPQRTAESIYLVGAGHCAKAIAQAARTCGLRITVIEDRADVVEAFEPADCRIADKPPIEFISHRDWEPGDAIILVNRGYQLDRDALEAALAKTGFGYLGMMGSRRKVLRVYDELKQRGIDPASFERVHAPIGLDIGADSPEEIAISVLAEILAALRHRSGRPFQLTKTEPNPVLAQNATRGNTNTE
jgi:xanthine dehydrogenase accessory factor